MAENSQNDKLLDGKMETEKPGRGPRGSHSKALKRDHAAAVIEGGLEVSKLI